jgi:hypothetical protein
MATPVRAYAEQAAIKTQMAFLEGMAPMTRDFLDKLEQIRNAVAHHMYGEEGTWFLELKGLSVPSGENCAAKC